MDIYIYTYIRIYIYIFIYRGVYRVYGLRVLGFRVQGLGFRVKTPRRGLYRDYARDYYRAYKGGC